MATIKQFEDLIAWQKARGLAREAYKVFRDCRDYGFRDQIQRAAVSVMSNIAEGFESGTRQEFLNYLYIAKASAGEVRSQLYAAYDIGYLNIETFKSLNLLALECSRLISSFAKSLKSSPVGGLQFKKEKSRAELDREAFQEWTREELRTENPEIYEKYFRETHEPKKQS